MGSERLPGIKALVWSQTPLDKHSETVNPTPLL